MIPIAVNIVPITPAARKLTQASLSFVCSPVNTAPITENKIEFKIKPTFHWHRDGSKRITARIGTPILEIVSSFSGQQVFTTHKGTKIQCICILATMVFLHCKGNRFLVD